MRRSIGALLALMLTTSLVTSCAREPPGPANHIDVRAGADVHLVRDDGQLEITIPGSSITGSGSLSTEAIEYEGLTGWSITLGGDAELVGEATIIYFGDVTGDEPPPALFYRETDDEPFSYGGDPEVLGNGKFAVTTTHFSDWFIFDWGDLLTKGADLARQAFGENPGADVACENTDEALAAGYSVSLSGSADTYVWCQGREDDLPVVKVGNPWPYAVRIEVTPGLVLTNPDETLASLIPQLFSALSEPPSIAGNEAFILGPGDSFTFRWASQTAKQQAIQAKPSPAAYIASALMFSVQTVQLIWHGGKPAEILKMLADTASCTTGFAEMVQADVGDALAASDYVQGAVDTVFACLGKVFEKVYGDEGVFGNRLIAAVSWLLTGIKLVVYSGVAVANINPVTALIDGPEVLADVPTVNSATFCRQLFDQPLVRRATEVVGYSWDEVQWRETKKLVGRVTLADDYLECSIYAGGMAPPYEVNTYVEFFARNGTAQDEYAYVDASRSDAVARDSDLVRVDLELESGHGFLTLYDGRPGYNSHARGYAYRGNVFVTYDFSIGLLTGSNQLGWPDNATLTSVAAEVIDRALNYAGG